MTTTTSVHSQAFGFLSHLETGTDPRTGQYSCGLSLPELNNNDLMGPELVLRLGFNPLNTLDSGFGLGWSLQLTQYDINRKTISLASGESYRVTSSSSDSNQLLMEEKKIDTFHLHDLGGEQYQVVHKSGLIEDLKLVGSDRIALPVTVCSASGRRVTLAYRTWNGQSMLERISDGDGEPLLAITRTGTSVQLLLHPGKTWESLYTLRLSGGEARVSSIELPTDELASWRFEYVEREGLLCISRVEGPLGGHELINYDNGEHLFPDGIRRLPRVYRHVRDPGSQQLAIETRYDYSDENFLGYRAPGLSWDPDGPDNLYQVVADYRYDSTEMLWDTQADKALRSIRRVFNRFHLTVEETTSQEDCVRSVLTEYNVQDGLTFKEQDPRCQLPKSVTNSWYRKSETGRSRDETVTTEYDLHGNETLRIEASGIREVSEYYPAEGADGCPADPHGFVRYLKSKTVRPDADAEHGEAHALRTEYRYAGQAPVSGGNHEWLKVVEETLYDDDDDTELHKQVTHYIDQPGDPFQHGRTVKTEFVMGARRIFTDYFYSKGLGRRAKENVLHTVEVISNSFDQATKTISHEQSLVNGKPLLELDDNDMEIAYRYDSLDRVIEETVAPGTDYQATRTYQYVLVNTATGRASQTVTDVKQAQTRSYLDGLQRVVLEQRSELGKVFRDIYSARYDRFGQKLESTHIDWLDGEDRLLTSRYTYDDWGEQDSVTGPDGVTAHTLGNPITRETQTWRDGEGRTVTRENRFEKPDSVERLDLDGQRYSLREYFYDGLGRTHHDFDEMQQFRYYQYDAFDRMTLSGIPGLSDNHLVERRYVAHSIKDLPVWIGVDGVTLGEQDFDGLGRRLFLQVGPRREEYVYQGGSLRPEKRLTPRQDSIDYEYAPQLTDAPVALSADGQKASFTFDTDDAMLLAAENHTGRREFAYDGGRHLKTERWIADGQTWEASYQHSREGRQLLHRDVNGLETRSDYDLQGRLEHIRQGNVEVVHEYDQVSRPWRSTCRDLEAGSELVTTLAFDDWSREIGRSLELNGQPLRSITQTWRADDRLGSRVLESAGQVVLEETFDYDPRGRVSLHTCEGSEQPRDRHGNAIAEQAFVYDPMDNLVEVRTRFVDGTEDLCRRSFASDDPCQLVNLVHSHPDYPASIDLDYDANGNLLSDEEGRELVYDSQSRLLEVKDKDGQRLSAYHYDAHGQLSGEEHGKTALARRFYQGQRLGCSVQGDTRISFLHDDDRPLAQQQPDRANGTLLLLTDGNRSVLGESQGDSLRETRYSAYGARADGDLECPLGFNGEIRDGGTGWYLLGNGYRAYNPYLMCFHSPDSLSPFGAGGVNAYMYCGGDPVNFRDPTGHFFKMPGWLGDVLMYGGLALGAAATIATGGAMAFSTAGFWASFKAATVATKVSLGLGAISTGTGVTALMSDDRHFKRTMALTSFVTGVAAVGAGVLGHFMKSASAADEAASLAGSTGSIKPTASNAPVTPNPASTTLGNSSDDLMSVTKQSQGDAFEMMHSDLLESPLVAKPPSSPLNSPKVTRSQGPVASTSKGGMRNYQAPDDIQRMELNTIFESRKAKLPIEEALKKLRNSKTLVMGPRK